MLAVFTAFPMFAQFQDALQKYFLQSLVPDSIAQPVLRRADPVRRQGQPARRGRPGAARAHRAGADADDRPHAERDLARAQAAADRAARARLLGGGDARAAAARREPEPAPRTRSSASRGVVGGMPGGVGLLLDALEFALLAAAHARRCSTTCPTPTCAGATRWPAACSSPSASSSPSARWPGTSARCRPIRDRLRRLRDACRSC